MYFCVVCHRISVIITILGPQWQASDQLDALSYVASFYFIHWRSSDNHSRVLSFWLVFRYQALNVHAHVFS